jgi:phage shock protein A
MFGSLKTLFVRASARTEDALRDTYAIELIDQKIREVETSLMAAKSTLASLIQRQRSEQALAGGLAARITALTARIVQALDSGRNDLAIEGALATARRPDFQNRSRAQRKAAGKLRDGRQVTGPDHTARPAGPDPAGQISHRRDHDCGIVDSAYCYIA